MSDSTQLTEEQKRAARIAATERIALITGGPGTGKTTCLRRVANDAAARGERLALLAPTGKAAARVAEQTGRAAQTIHRAIGWSPAGTPLRDERNPLDADVVVVDESSMVDSLLLARLLRAVPQGARVVLVGDDAQLPPVGPGAPFRDLLACPDVPRARLTAIFRQGEGSPVAEAARAVLRGAEPPTRSGPAGAFAWFERPEEEIVGTIVKLARDVIPAKFGIGGDDAIQVLCPGREGDVSAASINAALAEVYNPAVKLRGGGAAFYPGDKVLNTRNDYELLVFNGEVGRCVGATRTQATVRFPDRDVVFRGAEALGALMPAWCLTVHRAQGSEYPVVVIALSGRHRPLLTRRLLYTAITRAARVCVVVSTRATKQTVLSNAVEELRVTALSARLARLRRG